MISAVVKLPLKPCLPVAQKLQSSMQPTCEDTHSVLRPRSGISTLSTQSPPPVRTTHLQVPSAERRRSTTSGTCKDAVSPSQVRKLLAKSVMRSKSKHPR